MCGPAGSGKSAVAARLVADGFVRLSFDVEAWARGARTMPLPDSLQAAIDADLRARLIELVRAGRDVVLDFSFWSRQLRQEWRAVLAPLGVVAETVYLATDRGTALARVRARTGRGPDDFQLTEELAARYFDGFEPPTSSEGPLTVIGNQPAGDGDAPDGIGYP